MVIYRVFFPSNVDKKHLSILTTTLYDSRIEISDPIISSVPLEQENVVPAIVIDVTYINPRMSTIDPRYQALNFNVNCFWEGEMISPGKKRYVTVIDPRAEKHLEEIYRSCRFHMHHGPKYCGSSIIVSRGEVPTPSVGHGYGKMAIIETKTRIEDIRHQLSTVSREFAYTIEERIDVMRV